MFLKLLQATVVAVIILCAVLFLVQSIQYLTQDTVSNKELSSQIGYLGITVIILLAAILFKKK